MKPLFLRFVLIFLQQACFHVSCVANCTNVTRMDVYVRTPITVILSDETQWTTLV